MRAAQSGRSSTSIHADDDPFESCGNSPSVGGETLQHSLVELTSLFTNQGLTAPPLDFTVSDRVRRGTTCRAEILSAFNRLDGDGPPRWHARDEVIAEVRRVNRRYPAGTIRRILHYDLVGRSTLNHIASGDLERDGDRFRLR